MEDIKIMAEPAPTGRTCKFVVDRPVYAEGAAFFTTKDSTVHSALAKRIFDLPSVTAVFVGGNAVSVTAGPFDDWRPLARQIAVAIRDQLRSGAPAVAASYRASGAGDARELEIRRKVEEILETQINPAIAAHGGHIALVDVKGSDIFLQMSGGCQGCASSTATLKLGVESAIRDRVPEVGQILDVTDHAAGQSPYYAER